MNHDIAAIIIQNYDIIIMIITVIYIIYLNIVIIRYIIINCLYSYDYYHNLMQFLMMIITRIQSTMASY